MKHVDMMGQAVAVGDTVTAAFRIHNTAVLRRGVVTKVAIGHEPNIVQQRDTPMVPVIWVDWTHSTHDFRLPLRPTKIASRKCLKI